MKKSSFIGGIMVGTVAGLLSSLIFGYFSGRSELSRERLAIEAETVQLRQEFAIHCNRGFAVDPSAGSYGFQLSWLPRIGNAALERLYANLQSRSTLNADEALLVAALPRLFSDEIESYANTQYRYLPRDAVRQYMDAFYQLCAWAKRGEATLH